MGDKLLNILTRTSNRPNAFNLNRLTVTTQTYKNIRHIISVDDEFTEKYVKNHTNDYVFVDKEKLINEDNSPNPNTGKYSPHNLYFNVLNNRINDGWVMILDDDDRLINNKVIETIMSKITDENTMVIFQMKFPNNSVIPANGTLNLKPRLGNIGSPCVVFHSKYLNNIEWDGWKCGDFRFIDKIYNKVDKIITIEEKFVIIGQIGDGNRVDI